MVFMLVIMCANVVTLAVGGPTILTESSENEVVTHNFPFVTRAQWNARTAKRKNDLNVPVPFVVIHHSYTPPACFDRQQCARAMRSMQAFHMDDRGWWDIGYNFAVGSDGAAYEGRGWSVMGAHALHFNSVSIGICLIGDWRDNLPPIQQIKTAKALIETGVKLGYIHPNYKLVGHRQVRDTECPGNALYKDIQLWPNYSPFPKSVVDLVDINELPESVKKMLKEKKT